MSEALLKDRDYTVIVAKTSPSTSSVPPGFASRWIAAETAILALTEKCEELDPDGITVYISSKEHPPILFKKYDRVTPKTLRQIFQEHYPPDDLNLLDGLQVALNDYFARKLAGQTKPNGEIIIVLIDGEPKNRMEVVKLIVDATRRMERDGELGIGFAQVGDDLITRGFLAALDDDLKLAGAKFDIVDTKVLAQIEPNALTDFLLDTLRD